MQKLLKHNQFLSNLILEQIESGELPFKLSYRLNVLLQKINHKISDKLISSNNNDLSSKFTLIDYDDNDIDMFTYATSSKIIEFITQKTLSDEISMNINYFHRSSDIGLDNLIWKQNRTPIRIGRFINKLYPNTFVNAGKPGEDIESFTDALKTERTKDMGIFRIVEGEDIVKYYNVNMYESNGNGSSLYGSCMSYSKCSPYIGFYAKNKGVKLVILMSENEEDKIIGRALLWDIIEIDGEEVDRKFMDRIYVIKSQEMGKFKELARKNNWLYKKTQDMWSDTEIVDPKDSSTKHRTIVINNIESHNSYPYMDTLKYYSIDDGFLSNSKNIEHNCILESTDGGFYDINDETYYVYSIYHNGVINTNDMIWSDTENRYIATDESVYSNDLSEWVSMEYAEENWTYSEKEDDWFDNNNIVYITSEDCHVSQNYADQHYIESSYDYEWYSHEDGLPSEKWGIVPIENSIRVITSDDINLDELNDEDDDFDNSSIIDNRWKKDGTYFTIYDPIRKREWNFDILLINSPIIEKIKKGVV